MGLKDYRLWVMGQLDSTYSAPPRGSERVYTKIKAKVITVFIFWFLFFLCASWK
jgi:hypothetical protein